MEPIDAGSDDQSRRKCPPHKPLEDIREGEGIRDGVTVVGTYVNDSEQLFDVVAAARPGGERALRELLGELRVAFRASEVERAPAEIAEYFRSSDAPDGEA